jgi:hypothetical protein
LHHERRCLVAAYDLLVVVVTVVDVCVTVENGVTGVTVLEYTVTVSADRKLLQ